MTHADGVIGHIEVSDGTRAGVRISRGGSQFVITEAKMFSGLSSGTTRAPGYDQAARNVACLAWAVYQAAQPLEAYRSLAFWVLAPEEQNGRNIFACMSRQSIEQKIRQRIDQCEASWRTSRLEQWWRDWLLPVMDRISMVRVPWEGVVAAVTASDAQLGTACARCMVDQQMTFTEVVECLETNLLRQALADAGGNRTLGARHLGLSLSTLRDKLQRHGLDDGSNGHVD